MNDHILKVGTCLHCLLGLKLTADHKLNTYIRAITKRKIGKNPRPHRFRNYLTPLPCSIFITVRSDQEWIVPDKEEHVLSRLNIG